MTRAENRRIKLPCLASTIQSYLKKFLCSAHHVSRHLFSPSRHSLQIFYCHLRDTPRGGLNYLSESDRLTSCFKITDRLLRNASPCLSEIIEATVRATFRHPHADHSPLFVLCQKRQINVHHRQTQAENYLFHKFYPQYCLPGLHFGLSLSQFLISCVVDWTKRQFFHHTLIFAHRVALQSFSFTRLLHLAFFPDFHDQSYYWTS